MPVPGRNERGADTEYHIRVQVTIAVAEHMSDQPFVARRVDHEMHVSRPPRMPGRSLQHASRRTVGWNRIRLRKHRPEMEPPLIVGAQHPATPMRIVWILHVVITVGIRLPHFDAGVRNRLAVQSAHCPLHMARLALRAIRQIPAQRIFRRVRHVKRAEHGRLSASRGLAVVLRDHQHRQAQRVRQQNEFLALVVGLMAGGGEKLDSLEPLLLRQLHLTCKRMQVPYQRSHDALQARIGRIGNALEECIGNGIFVDISHAGFPAVTA